MAIFTVKITELSFSVAAFNKLFGIIDIAVNHAAAVPADDVAQSLRRQYTFAACDGSISRLIALDKFSAAAEGTLFDLNGMQCACHDYSSLSG